MEYLLTTENLTKQYGSQKAADNVNLHIKKGDIYGLIGRNGAGKTTIMKMICSLAKQTSGKISFAGSENCDSANYREKIGSLIEAPGLFGNMSARDNLVMKAKLAGTGEEDIDRILALVGLKDVGKKKADAFSLGMRQRLGIGLALIGNPELLILDEPINGLDPQGIAEVRDTLTKLTNEQNITIMISSHILEELSKIATSYGIIDNGKLIMEMSKDELEAKCSERIEISVSDSAVVCSVLDKMGISDYKVVDKNMVCVYEQFSRMGEINAELFKSGVTVNSIGIAHDDLEKFFLDVTGGNNNA